MDAQAFAEQWISDWNRKDVDAVLSHFSEGVVFTSSRAQAILGSARVEGKSKLKQYWTTAISRIQTIRFSLIFFLMKPEPTRSTLFPYTALFRAEHDAARAGDAL